VLPIAVRGWSAPRSSLHALWNEFIYALTFTSSSEQIHASVGVTTELIAATSTTGLVDGRRRPGLGPIVVLYVFFLDYYVSGLTARHQVTRRSPVDLARRATNQAEPPKPPAVRHTRASRR